MHVIRIIGVAAIAAATLLPGWSQPQQDVAAKWKPERRHPGHMMKVDYVPKKDAFVIGESVDVVLTITNVGEAPFQFMRGGRQRGARDNQFAFTAQFDRTMLPDVGDPINFGGLGTYVTLQPSDAVEIPVDLTDWFEFKEDGTYLLRGSYYMAFSVPDVDEYTLIWEDFATAEFSVMMIDEE